MLNLLQECSGAKVIGITGHVRPDGDCVGSCMALYMYLHKVMPEADITVYLEESAKSYYHIKHLQVIDSSFQAKDKYDVFFCLDSMPDRVGQGEALYESAAKKINIDHHITNSGCGDVNYEVNNLMYYENLFNERLLYHRENKKNGSLYFKLIIGLGALMIIILI